MHINWLINPHLFMHSLSNLFLSNEAAELICHGPFRFGRSAILGIILLSGHWVWDWKQCGSSRGNVCPVTRVVSGPWNRLYLGVGWLPLSSLAISFCLLDASLGFPSPLWALSYPSIYSLSYRRWRCFLLVATENPEGEVLPWSPQRSFTFS